MRVAVMDFSALDENFIRGCLSSVTRAFFTTPHDGDVVVYLFEFPQFS